MKAKDLIIKYEPCNDSLDWLGNREVSNIEDVRQIINDCKRGDWLLWLAVKLGVNKRKIFLAKSRVAKQVLHLMRDERSRKAVYVAEQYGLGLANEDDLSAYAYAAYAADAAAAAAAADAADAAAAAAAAAYAADAAAAAAAAAYAADAAAYAAADAADAAYAADAAAAAAAAADAAATRDNSLENSAIICREIFMNDLLDALKIKQYEF